MLIILYLVYIILNSIGELYVLFLLFKYSENNVSSKFILRF